MRFAKIIFYITFFLLQLLSVRGQEMYYSQSGANKLFHNPSFAGSELSAQIFLGYRNQFSAIASGMNSYTLTIDGKIPSSRSGVGLSAAQDVGLRGAGVLSSVYGYYSFKIYDAKKSSINIGLKGGFMLKSLNSQNFVFPDQYNGNSTIENFDINKMTPDFGLGVSGNFNKLFAGVGVEHLTRPNISLNSELFLKPELSAFIGYIIPVYKGKYNSRSEFSQIIPSVSFFNKNGYNQLFYGAAYQHKLFYFGIFARNNMHFSIFDAVFIGKINIKNIVIGYSYDYSISKYKGVSFGGSNEITLQYSFEFNENKQTHKAIKCPRF